MLLYMSEKITNIHVYTFAAFLLTFWKCFPLTVLLPASTPIGKEVLPGAYLILAVNSDLICSWCYT